jgi:hypothetical protein
MADTLSNIVMRRAKVEYGATSALGEDFGLVKDVKIKISPAVSERDSQGKMYVPGYKIEGQLRVMENDQASLTTLMTLIGDSAANYVKFTDRHTAANSFKSDRAIAFHLDSELDLNGKADGFLVKFAWIMDAASIDNIIP